MNAKITPPGVGSAGGAVEDGFGNLAKDYSTPRFFNHDASNEIDRLIQENKRLQEEVHDLKSVIMGLLSENDQGVSS
ncbi:hypothetical protein [Candidatus Thiodiazotropha sp. CDECU1]|uniref:hypothetical protein n=1 Tax=Candidatus Thiodiazotropha sp. CDECU1 TaxID=3065865 RepID=UPI002930192D|nr:hypothetical protein [Candidatus Thiodiazotropha sp. CDECU1]